MSDCRYGDPTCPCQDGDVCHYVAGWTTPAMAVPPEYVDKALNKLEAEIKRLGKIEAAARDTKENVKAANEIRELYSAINVAIACLTIDDDGGALDALHGAENGVRNKLEN